MRFRIFGGMAGACCWLATAACLSFPRVFFVLCIVYLRCLAAQRLHTGGMVLLLRGARADGRERRRGGRRTCGIAGISVNAYQYMA